MREGKFLLTFLFFVFLSSVSSSYATDLGNSPEWRALLHFPKQASVSLIDDPSFFFSPEGRTNPAAELAASVQAFSIPPQVTGDESVQCRFRGRFRWIQRHAPQLASRFVAQDCPAWDKLSDRVKPYLATLVFPDGYMNSPASMFGHTLLRIDQADPQPLRSFAVNYAAQTREENGIAYTINGLTGNYKGYFSLMAYPEKLKEYQYGEQRDIWEFQLKLSPAEVSTLLEHVWDLQNAYSDYYFFDRNCSYQLLALLEAVRPDLDLLNNWGASVIPVDTIRRLDRVGLLGESNVRLSQASKINQQLQEFTPEEIDLIKRLGTPAAGVSDLELPNDVHRRALILEAALDYLQWERSRQNISLDSYRSRFLHLLSIRSQIKKDALAATLPTTKAYAPTSPLDGHGTQKLSFSLIQQGAIQDIGLSYRPAFHDMQERQNGYRTGAGISFFEARARWSRNENAIKVDAFDLLKIESMSPRNELLKPFSWRIHVGIKRADPLDLTSPLQPHATAGAGPTYRFGRDKGLLFGTAETVLSRDKNTGTNFANLGWRMGVQWRPNDRISLTASAHGWFKDSEYTKPDQLVELDAHYFLSKDQSLQFQRKNSLIDSNKSAIHQIAWNLFF
jgi:hypothetical protein